MKSIHNNLTSGFSCVVGYSKKTELYISGDRGDFSGVIGGLLISDMVDRLLLVTTDQRYESFLDASLF